MDKLNSFLKNLVLFLAIFLAVQYAFSLFQDKEHDALKDSGNITFNTTSIEYSRKQTVAVEIGNYTKNEITIKSECPGEPLNVYKLEDGDWKEKTATPELNCSEIKDIVIPSNSKKVVTYDNWQNAIFGELGRFKIETSLIVEEKERLLTTGEFTVIKEGMLSQLWNGIFYRPIYNGLMYLTSVMPNADLGLAIILLTIIIRTILLAPSHKALKAQRKLQEIQPRLEKIKEKYKGDQQRIATETMQLWKEAKVSPFGSCLPILLQLPFLIAIFYVIQNGLNPDNAYLLYPSLSGFSLTEINTDFFNILDLRKPNLYVLPLIVGGMQFIQMKLAMAKIQTKGSGNQFQNEMQKATQSMTYIMPVMIAVFTASVPAGVGLYWGASTLYGIVQQIFVNKYSKIGGSESQEPKVKVISK